MLVAENPDDPANPLALLPAPAVPCWTTAPPHGRREGLGAYFWQLFCTLSPMTWDEHGLSQRWLFFQTEGGSGPRILNPPSRSPGVRKNHREETAIEG